MDELVEMFLEGQRQFGARVRAVGTAWNSPTPASEWDVSALVEHVVDEQRWVAPLMDGHDLQAAGEVVQQSGAAGGDLAAAWESAALSAADAVRQPGAVERTVDLSRGPTSARAYLSEMVLDATVHSWDLGVAIGFDEPLPDDLVDYVYAVLVAYGDLSGTGMFDPPVAVADDAPVIDKLVALTGRTPR